MRLLTIPAASAESGIPASTLRRACADGRLLGARRHGRDWAIPAQALAQFPRRARGRPRKGEG